MRNLPNEDIPIIGPWIGRIGQVRATMATPCTIEPEVWVLAGFHGVPRLLWSLFKPDAWDLTTERFQRGHKKKRRRRFRFGGMIEDVDFRGRGKGLQWAVFRLGSLAERVGWWFLIVDASTELAVHWTSTAYIWSGCPVPMGSSAKLVCDDIVGNPAPTGGTFAQWNVGYTQPPLEATISRIFVPPGMVASPALNFEIGTPPDPYPAAQQIEIRLVDLTSGGVYDEWTFGDPSKPRRGRGVWMNPGYLNPERQWAMEYQTNGGYFLIKGSLTVNASPVQGFEFDP